MDRMVGMLRSRFQALDLRGKITLALLLATLLLGGVVTLVTYATEYRNAVRYTSALLEARGHLEQREIELQLKSLMALSESIAGNAVTANALADSQGREIYLAPLLRNQILPVAGASLYLTDYRGHRIAGQDGRGRSLETHPAFLDMVASSRAVAAVDGASLLILLPVIYRLTGSVEGSIVVEVPFERLLSPPGSSGRHHLSDPSGRILAGQLPEGEAFEVVVPLSVAAPLDRLGLTLHLSEDRGSALRNLHQLLATLLGLGVLVMLAMAALARAGARFITAPLGVIAAAAEEIAASGRPVARLPISGDDEFGRLSAAFNTMVDRLAESYGELEQRVIDRTRQLEESRQEAQKASNLLREAVGSIALGFTIYDENDCLVICNEAYLNFYEESRDLILPGSRFEDIVRGGAMRGQYNLEGRTADAWVRDRVAQHQNANGQFIEQRLGDGRWLLIVEHRTPSGYIVGNRIDITELKQNEARIRDRTEQLNAIFDLSPDGFVSFDTDHRVKYASPAFQRMTGLAQAEIIGLDEAGFAARLTRECPPDAPFPGFATLRAQQNVGAGGTAVGHGAHRRVLMEVGRTGRRVLDVGIRTSEAESVSQILYFRDITHETEVDRMKSEFLSTAAHELRTPMASIYGFTELLISQDFSPGERREFLETIFRQSELMVSIINELLDLARIEARRGKDFVIEPIPAAAIIREVVGAFRLPDGRDAPLLDEVPAPCTVRADRKKLTQAISNVLSNAYKYSPAGGPVSIELIAGGDDEAHLGIRIRDPGIGMTPAQRARVCERFYRADTSGKIPGTGLGMSIVKEIVEILDGSIDIDSQPGAGTTVTLWLPRVAGATQEVGHGTH